uniref:Uncharacterized protein n=1 Tax=Arundo donax TaxID=35708 RepID=A0A0A8Z745_ARUDO
MWSRICQQTNHQGQMVSMACSSKNIGTL